MGSAALVNAHCLTYEMSQQTLETFKQKYKGKWYPKFFVSAAIKLLYEPA